MIECGSREEVNRVVALGRTLFGTSQVFLDRWTSEAGRARLLRKEGAMWIVAKGIPLHIRSVDLFRQIGEVCGGFVEHDSQWCPLSSVRIKVAGSGSVPENVVVRHLDEVFDIRIWKESSGMLEKDVRGKEPKRKEVVERAVNGLSCLGAEFFSGSGRGEEGGPSSVFTAEAISSLSPGKIQGGNHFFGADEVEATVERRSGGMGQAVVVSDFVQRSLPGGRTSEGLKDTLMRCVDATKRGSSGYDMQEKFLGGLKRLDGFVGLMLREDVGLCVLTRQCSDDFLKPFLCLGSDHEGGLFREEAGQKGLGPVGSGSILIPFNLSVESWRGIRCGPARLTKVGLDWVKKGGKADEGPDWVSLPNSAQGEEDAPPFAQLEDGRSSESSSTLTEDDEAVLRAVEKVSKILNLSGETATGREEISIKDSAERVLRRRRINYKKSKTERELSRIGSSVEKLAEFKQMGRRSGMSGHVPFRNDS
ncbi:hypothetical protein LINPERHAP2_LOCUS8783 [Linum perenne]